MLKSFSILSIALLFTGSAISQVATNAASKIRFATINQVGLLTGSGGQSATVQTINGVRLNTWFTGIGLGIDYYGTRGIPLFLDVRKDLSNKKNSPFIYADGGVHFPWGTIAQNQSKGYVVSSSESGAYFDGGVGLKLNTKNIGDILLSAGYSYKKVTDNVEMFSNWGWPTPVASNEYYNYEYRRVVIKIGLQL